MRRILMVVLMIGAVLPLARSQAQGDNLLTNPGFDGGLVAGPGGAVPAGWTMWGGAASDKESLSALTRSAPYSWRFRKEFGTFTGGGYQTVDVQPGGTYRFSIFSMIWTCDDEVFACRNETSTYSDPSSGGRVRIGIDVSGGTNPFASTVQWSGFYTPHTWGSFQYMSIDAIAPGARLTVFTYFTADKAMRFNDVFWDDASLTLVAPPSSGDSPADDAPDDNTDAQPRSTAVPVAVDPIVRSDGSEVHVVESGQSLWAIATAYGVSLDTLRELNDLYDTDTIFAGQEIIVKAAQAEVVAPRSTATPTPTTSSPREGTASITPFQTLAVTGIAQSFNTTTPTAAPTTATVAVNVNNSPDNDDAAIRGGVVALAIMVIIIAVGVAGGILYIVWQVTFPRTPRY